VIGLYIQNKEGYIINLRVHEVKYLFNAVVTLKVKKKRKISPPPSLTTKNLLTD